MNIRKNLQIIKKIILTIINKIIDEKDKNNNIMKIYYQNKIQIYYKQYNCKCQNRYSNRAYLWKSCMFF